VTKLDPIQTLLILTIAFIVGIEGWFGSPFVMWSPLINSTLVGIVLANPEAGVYIGAILTVVYFGVVQIGASAPPDQAVAGMVGAAVFIEGGGAVGGDPTVGLLVATAAAILGTYFNIATQTINTVWIHLADSAAEVGGTKRIQIYNALGLPVFGIFKAAAVGVWIILTEDIIQFVDDIPTWFFNGLSAAGGLLTCLGIGILLSLMYRRELIPWFALGFVFASYVFWGSGFNLVASTIAVFGLVAAFYLAKGQGAETPG
jgi:mannose/fructose/N-acetylgalactosamine-specific phosphotransferase system component IIC